MIVITVITEGLPIYSLGSLISPSMPQFLSVNKGDNCYHLSHHGVAVSRDTVTETLIPKLNFSAQEGDVTLGRTVA